jgi:N-acetylmuramate 1-kinase
MSTSVTHSNSKIFWPDSARGESFQRWLHVVSQSFALIVDSVHLASSDASFRRYFRIAATNHANFIIMDADPIKENNEKFVHVAQLMHAAGLKVPKILAWDEENGFLLLTDLGRQTALQTLRTMGDPSPPPFALFTSAIDALITWQLASETALLPVYDSQLLMKELSLFTLWYVGAYKKITLTEEEQTQLSSCFTQIVQNNLSQAMVFVHRDFMLRNLMSPPKGLDYLAQDGLGILDFQDAVYGPITYDIASLIRDAFVSWDDEFCSLVVRHYWEQAKSVDLPVGENFNDFYGAVEWMGLQRHLKIAGIFARLTLRDGKPQYLADIPRFIGYIRTTCTRYSELIHLLRLIDRIEQSESTES